MGSQIGALFGGLWGDAGQNFVDLQGGPDKVFGTKPEVAKFTPTNLDEEIAKAVGANVKNADAILAMIEKFVPGFSNIVKKGLGTSMDLMSGKIPQDVQDAVMRSSAFKAGQGGFSGTGMERALTARDFGLTSLNLLEAGSNAAQKWTKLAETSVDPFILKTMEQAGTTAANNAGIQAQKQAEFNVKAAPDPGAAGTFALDTALGMQMLSLGMSMGGAAMGGGGGAKGASGAQQAGAWASAFGGAQSAGSPWAMTGGSGGGLAYQYNPSSNVYERVPQAQAVWGGG